MFRHHKSFSYFLNKSRRNFVYSHAHFVWSRRARRSRDLPPRSAAPGASPSCPSVPTGRGLLTNRSSFQGEHSLCMWVYYMANTVEKRYDEHLLDGLRWSKIVLCNLNPPLCSVGNFNMNEMRHTCNSSLFCHTMYVFAYLACLWRRKF